MVDFASTQAQAKEVAPPASYEGGHGQAPERFSSAHRRRGGQDVPQTRGDSRHHRDATKGVCSLVLV
jgi:hypothetical protein